MTANRLVNKDWSRLNKCLLLFGTLIFISIIVLIIVPQKSSAAVTGACVNCHTMHNSQDNAVMDTLASGLAWESTGPNEALLRGTCLGCHGQGGTNKIVTLTDGSASSDVPQVWHDDPSGDLAGGNFAYITGASNKGPGGNNKGHNVIDLGPGYEENVLFNPPGAHHASQVTAVELTCAGANGCHGTRDSAMPSGIPAIKGAHHLNVDGQLSTPTEVYNSYRFLKGVAGYENNDPLAPWQNNAAQHNEYSGAIQPMSLVGCDSAKCHPAGNTAQVEPSSPTISAFCGTCHGAFHSLQGIGGDTNSPFTRHPTDTLIPPDGEYAAYDTYNPEAPVGRTSVPSGPLPGVSPGSDVVTCLSCHVAHASNYPDMLRWDYDAALTGGGGSGTACFVCHTTK